MVEKLQEKIEKVKQAVKRCGLDSECVGCPYENQHCSELDRDIITVIDCLEAKVPRWISVEERLPDGFATVLIMRDDIKQACVGWLIDGHWSVPKGVRVTHWMPLPEAPKGGAE